MTLPEKMTTIGIEAPGGPEALIPVEINIPYPAEGEVLIKVTAAGVNRADVFQRRGLYPPPEGAPATPGLEVSGTIEIAGRGTSRFKPGDQVCALVPGGGYAEYCVAREGHCLPIPENVTLEQAGGVPETTFTVWASVFERGRLVRGETLLVHGGSSGIGTTAIQMAAALYGTVVFVTAGSDEKCKACEKLGAQRAINYLVEDYVEIVKRETDGAGVDVILDMVGGDYIERNIHAAARDGRIVNIAYLNGSRADVDFRHVMLKRLTLTGATLRARSIEDKAQIASDLETSVWPLFADGAIQPVIDRTFPLADAPGAHTHMEASQHIGKILLLP